VSLLILVVLAAQALQHPFLESLHSPDDEPVAPATFSFEFEHEELSRERVQVRGSGCGFHLCDIAVAEGVGCGVSLQLGAFCPQLRLSVVLNAVTAAKRNY
jgi:hypothetical protein